MDSGSPNQTRKLDNSHEGAERARPGSFQQVLDALPSAVYTTDAAGRITYCNQAAIDLAGRNPQIGVDQWCVTWRLYREDGTPMPHDQCPMAIALKEKRPVRNMKAWAERPDGTRFPFVPYPTPFFDERGTLTGAINMLVDISAEMQAQKTQSLLIEELNHRVKNTLAIVQALARQTLRHTRSPESFVENFSGRIEALARAHTLLSQTTWKGGQLDVLLKNELLLGAARDPRVSASGPVVTLAPQQALNTALVFHELATNSRKHGALSAPSGRLAISWAVKEASGRRLHLRWAESGYGDRGNSYRSGFGTNFIKQIVEGDGGQAEMTSEAEGITWVLEISLPEAEDIDPVSVPLMALVPRSSAEAASSASPVRGSRVLIFEDEALIALELRQIIEDAGGQVVGMAGTVADGIAIIANTAADIALLDANLRGEPCDELASALQAHKVPFIYVTGYGRDVLPAKFREAAFIVKPFFSGDVVRAMDAVLGKSRVVQLKVRT